ncbi:ABC-F family ATP-binding cassette domain-containing protein [Agromyces archimandritae]|uniref:ABC-F family ATP-binding cassette domain-containing protein n=1 Tax=Agromyces archimandritae TaxID=2781962 RepID=A0A975FQ12_9MICO|nr:ABC-F family ATP-binding cassette domain-containing protein [Agromyces archimandritae]
MTHSHHLAADGLGWHYGDTRVFADLALTVAGDQRIGLIGENGAGKSTLLRLLAGGPDTVPVAAPRSGHGFEPGSGPGSGHGSGRIIRPARTGLLEQEPPFAPGDTVAGVLEAALAETRALERTLDEAAAAMADGTRASANRYADALDAAERADVWSAEARRDALLDGLGVAGIPGERRMGEVSGGQRSRFALAALLLRAPEGLLLDEPTNHLDDDAVAFLEAQLRAWRGPVLFASHDRAFLDGVATALFDVDPARAGTGGASASAVFGGGFSDYLLEKDAERARWERRYADEQAELARLRLAVADTARHVAHGRGPRDNDKFIHRFKGARNDQAISRRVRDAEQRLATLEREQVRRPRDPLAFAGIPSGSHALDASAGSLVQLADVRVDGRLGIDRLSIEPDARLLVTGANGAGKSTLLAVLAGRLAADAGSVHRRRGLRTGILEQDVRFADPAASPRELYARVLGERRAEQLPLTGLGLIAPRDADRPVGALSVGQQRRLALALVIAKPPHLFLLDEPTNHLSLALATELEDALGHYPGAVVIASHDRWLRRRWSGSALPSPPPARRSSRRAAPYRDPPPARPPVE